MKSVAGIFTSREEAERAAVEVERGGIARDRITVLSPGASPQEIASVNLSEDGQRLEAAQDLAWALFNSPAFLFNR